MPATFFRAPVASAATPTPTVIINVGFDSNVEGCPHVFGFAALERGYNVVLFEGPGQLGSIFEQGKG